MKALGLQYGISAQTVHNVIHEGTWQSRHKESRLYDGLVKVGALVDDGPDWLIDGEYRTGEGPIRTVITISDVAIADRPGEAR